MKGRQLLSGEHFTEDGTRTRPGPASRATSGREERARPPDDPGNPTVNFHGERRSNATHASTTDPERRLSRERQGHEAKLAYQGQS